MTTTENVRAIRDAVRALTAEPWRMGEPSDRVRAVYALDAADAPNTIQHERWNAHIVRSHGTPLAELEALARLVLALPDLLACALRYAESTDPENGDRHCIECGAVGDPNPDETMTHERGCMLGEALSLALGSEAHDAR